jgi:hypothetical protein
MCHLLMKWKRTVRDNAYIMSKGQHIYIQVLNLVDGRLFFWFTRFDTSTTVFRLDAAAFGPKIYL